MTCYEELKARGLIAQVTNEEEISKMINEGKAVFYIGFDPTADSLHVGHFMALCLMKRLQMAGNRPIALIGGGTGMVGDPSGRTDMRSMMTVETIQHNCACFKKQMERFIEFGDGKAQMGTPLTERTMTALTTSPFFTVPPGCALRTEATTTSPMLPNLRLEPPSTRMVLISLAPVLSATFR